MSNSAPTVQDLNVRSVSRSVRQGRIKSLGLESLSNKPSAPLRRDLRIDGLEFGTSVLNFQLSFDVPLRVVDVVVPSRDFLLKFLGVPPASSLFAFGMQTLKEFRHPALFVCTLEEALTDGGRGNFWLVRFGGKTARSTAGRSTAGRSTAGRSLMILAAFWTNKRFLQQQDGKVAACWLPSSCCCKPPRRCIRGRVQPPLFCEGTWSN